MKDENTRTRRQKRQPHPAPMAVSGVGVPTVHLGGSLQAPALAYGTGTAWFSKKEEAGENETLAASVASAISLGFRHIDCAEMYKNERSVGLGIRRSGVPREALFITSKVYQGLEDPEAALRASLARLGVSHLDLYLVHAPFSFPHPAAMRTAWGALEHCVALGLTKALGVSNFRVSDLQLILETATTPPVVNQVEFHPYLQSPELHSFCQRNGILLESYGGLAPILGAAGGPLDPVLRDMASRLQRTEAQILQRWAIQKGCMVVTTTSRVERMKEYLEVGSFQLGDEDMQAIDSVGRQRAYRRFWAAEYAPGKL